MAWVKIDDGFYANPKNIAAGKDGRALAIAALCWASAAGTDGRIPVGYLPVLYAQAEVTDAASVTLLGLGIWHAPGAPCDSEYCARAGLAEMSDGSFLIHDYLERNPSAEEVAAARRQRSEAGRRSAERRQRPVDSPLPPEPPSNGNGNGRSTSRRTSAATLAQQSPDPTRPDPNPSAVDLSDRQTLARAPSEAVGPSGIIDEALGIHAQIVLAKTNPATVRNPIRYLAGITERAASEHGPQLEEYVRGHPQTTSVDLAKAVFGHDDFDLARITPQEHTA